MAARKAGAMMQGPYKLTHGCWVAGLLIVGCVLAVAAVVCWWAAIQ